MRIVYMHACWHDLWAVLATKRACVGAQEGGLQLMFHISDSMISWEEHPNFLVALTEVVQILTADCYQMQMAYGSV